MSRKLTGDRQPMLRLAAVAAACAGWLAAPGTAIAEYQLVAQWGSEGAAQGQFAFETCNEPDWAGQADGSWEGEAACDWLDELWIDDPVIPAGIATDPSGIVYVADPGNARVQKFDGSGAFIDAWDATSVQGSALAYPVDVETDAAGNAYVADAATHKISKISPAGKYVTGWYTGLFSVPGGIAADAEGNVYVTLFGWFVAQQIVKYAPTSAGTYEQVAAWSEFGIEPGEIAAAFGIAVDPGGTSVVVADTGNSRIQRFASSDAGATYGFDVAWGSQGTSDGQFYWPLGVALDSAGAVYVTDAQNDRIQKLDPSGAHVATWGESGSGDGELDLPAGIAVDASGNVYVVDKLNQRVQKWAEVAATEVPEEPGEPEAPQAAESAGGGQTAAADAGTAPGADVSVAVTSPALDSGKTRSLARTTLARYLARGIEGYAEPGNAIERLKALLVRKRGDRCYRTDRPSKRTSCTKPSSRGLRTSADGDSVRILYRPYASGAKLRHSSSAKRLLKRMRRGEVLRSGTYVLTFRAYLESGGAESFSFKLKVT